MRKISFGLILCLLVGIAFPVLGSQIFNLTPVNYPVYVNGVEYKDSEHPLLNYDGRTYIPLSKIGDILNVKYNWDEDAFKLEIGDTAVAPSWTVDQLKAAAENSKLIITLGQSGSEAQIYAFEKKDGAWEQVLTASGYVGRNGITSSKREGDGETPAGVYGLSQPFGVADDPGSIIPYTKLTDNDFWVDDVDSKYYNMWAKGDAADKDWNSAEDLSSEKVAYKYVMAINYNLDPIVKGNGSAIFLHVETGGPTAGCVSVPEEKMIELLRFIDEDTKIVIAQSVKELLKY